MRIIAGQFGGRALTSPPGSSTRPTGARLREAVFSHLDAADWWPGFDGARVIDLFAGSGALGFEALSRGAGFALFVDMDARARGAIRQNADALDVMGRTRIHRRDATRLGTKPAGLGAPFTLAFLDPPYGKGLADQGLAALTAGQWLSPGAVVVVEVGADDPIPVDSGLEIKWQRDAGAARLVTAVWSGC